MNKKDLLFEAGEVLIHKASLEKVVVGRIVPVKIDVSEEGQEEKIVKSWSYSVSADSKGFHMVDAEIAHNSFKSIND